MQRAPLALTLRRQLSQRLQVGCRTLATLPVCIVVPIPRRLYTPNLSLHLPLQLWLLLVEAVRQTPRAHLQLKEVGPQGSQPLPVH